MIAGLLPAAAVCEETRGDADERELYEQERALIAGAVPRRRAEFATVRACARKALDRMGIAPVPILRGERREPLWPPGVVGSLTHCAGFRAAALADARDLAALGIDAEPHAPLPEGVLGAVTLAPERRMLAALAETDGGVHWDRVLFSAKESVFKAWFPATRRWLGFEDAEVVLEPGGRFVATVLAAEAPFAGFEGRWAVRDGVIATATAVEA
ncbi:4'-phosphopantetheinyl transferase family protein [Glycomyces paridis]|uniref:4'-phosphopantetheinyl transferase superfamily protein n=1 Tax=Glycomyces paridis TaxID=2126555 RepID=A0A4S8PLP1_9ACTN|nr:4'-phosphopantetheinyl transferase superfamily protein [Glycomyces paridis]THV29144.1 4'-phosphopantetheinyl transferase superfamily protein [Glycomyces paridis]